MQQTSSGFEGQHEIQEKSAHIEASNQLQRYECALTTLKVIDDVVTILLSTLDDKAFTQVLDTIIKATAGHQGFFGYLESDDLLIVPSLYGEVWEQCRMEEKSVAFPASIWGNSIWGRAIREQNTLYSNDPFEVPYGHPPIKNGAVTPIVFDGRTVGVIMVANSPDGFSQDDVDLLASIGKYLAPALNAWLQTKCNDEERAKFERALRLSERKFEEISRMMRSGLVMYEAVDDGADFIIRFYNDGAELIDSIIREKVLNRRVTEVFPGVEDFGLLDVLRRVYRTGDPAHHPVSFYDDKRISGWRENYVYKLSSSEIICVFEDVTEKKLAEEALRESEQKYRNVVENIGIGISIISPDMHVLSINKQMQEWFPRVDVARGSICYRDFNDPPRTSICEYCPTKLVFWDGLVHEALTETPSGGSNRHFRVVSSPIKDSNGNVIMVVEMVEDITEKLKWDAEFVRIEKLESLGLLAGGVAHDFNNLLTVILGNIVLSKADTIDNEERKKRLTNAENATERAKNLTRQLLTYSKGGTPVRAVTAIAPLVKESVAFGLSGSNVKPVYDIADDLSQANVDAGQLIQVIQNLVINAVHAMPRGGNIEVRAHDVGIDETSTVPLPQGKYVAIEVRDHGCGIPPKNLNHIFDPFFTTKNFGNGLGLATAYSIIKKHDGFIDVSSQLDVGTVFTLYLPAAEPMETKTSSASTTGEAGSPKPRLGRIMIMEDDPQISDVAGSILEQAGHTTRIVADGERAVAEYLEAHRAGRSYDVVILDLTVAGGKGGIEVLQEIRHLNPGARAIACSGHADDGTIESCREQGFAAYIVKPYRPDALRRLVRQVLDGKHPPESLPAGG